MARHIWRPMATTSMTADSSSIEQAAQLLRQGGLIGMPTETVYGLAGNAFSDEAVAAIFAAKQRPQFNPLIIHVSDIKSAQVLVQFNSLAECLAREFWPGPLTLVLPRLPECGVSLLAGAGLDTFAVRVPAHPVAQALLKASGVPIAAPSANRSGRISPTEAAHVAQELGDKVAMILEGGACVVGLESTVVDATGEVPVVLRSGAVTAEMISQACGAMPQWAGQGSAVHSPGMLASHYAPLVPVRLNAHEVREGEALLAFGAHLPLGASQMLNLSEKGDVQEAAANLFRYLRTLDDPRFSAIAVMPIPRDGLGVAINDRLARAAAVGRI